MKAKARSSILTHKSVARTASSAAEQLHDMHPKRDSVCSDHISKWVYWRASNYASPGLTFLRSRRPGPPAPAGHRHAGGYKTTGIFLDFWIVGGMREQPQGAPSTKAEGSPA